MNGIDYYSIDSALGEIYVSSTAKGVSSVIFGKERLRGNVHKINGSKATEEHNIRKTVLEMQRYLEGKLLKFSVRLDLSSGTPFQIKVWGKLLEIPYGKVITYKELAEQIGNIKACRAVGNAVGANPIPIIIPCHRVVRTDGIGGYSSEIEIKKMLLSLEGVLS